MTTRRTEPLPEEYAAPIFDVLERSRSAAAPPVDGDGAWAAAEAGQARIRTGYKASRRLASAGQVAAHALRIAAPDHPGADEEPWTRALTQAAPAISSWDWDTRMQGALDLRRTFKDLEPQPTGARPARLVAAWLAHASGPGLVPVTARLCDYVRENLDDQTVLAAAWYATHGPRLLPILTDGAPRPTGRPGIEDANRRQLLRAAVLGIHAGDIWTKKELSEAAGITRRTLDSWLGAVDISGLETPGAP